MMMMLLLVFGIDEGCCWSAALLSHWPRVYEFFIFKKMSAESSSTNSYRCQSMDEFIEKTEKLFTKSPNDTRYVMKFNHTKGRMNFKTTNNVLVVKYKTDQASDLQQLEKLNNLVMNVTTQKSRLNPYEQ